MSETYKESVLITGANGFVGSRLCHRLLDDGFRVIAGVRQSANLCLLDGLDLEYRYGDIMRPETLPDMIKDADYIIHNAGLIKAKSREQFMTVNCQGTKNILQAVMQNKPPKKFIYISSVSAAGPSMPNCPLTEDSPLHPLTDYGRSKAAAENEVIAAKDRINSTIIRPPAVYGPGDMESFTFFQILDNRIKPYLGNWKRRLHMVHVDDLCYGIFRAMKAETKSGSVYFIAESRGYSFGELVGYLRKATGRAALPVYMPGWVVKLAAFVTEKTMTAFGGTPMFTTEKANEILSGWELSVEKARKELGFQSQIPFPEGACQTIHWYREEGWL
jgi:dihydroflavonol-4-reductase